MSEKPNVIPLRRESPGFQRLSVALSLAVDIAAMERDGKPRVVPLFKPTDEPTEAA